MTHDEAAAVLDTLRLDGYATAHEAGMAALCVLAYITDLEARAARFLGCPCKEQVDAQARIEQLEAENADLRRDVREWLCESCNIVYPGPPAKGTACVVCPNCGGATGPYRAVLERIATARAEQAEGRIENALEELDGHGIDDILRVGRAIAILRGEDR